MFINQVEVSKGLTRTPVPLIRVGFLSEKLEIKRGHSAASLIGRVAVSLYLEKLENKVYTSMVHFRATKTTSGYTSHILRILFNDGNPAKCSTKEGPSLFSSSLKAFNETCKAAFSDEHRNAPTLL